MKRAAAKKSDGRNIAGTIYHRSHHPSLPAGNLYLHPWLIWRHPVPELDNHGHDYDGGRCRESRETFRITNRSEINGVHGPRTAQSRLTLRFLFAYTLFKTYIQPCYGWPRASPRWQSVFRCYRFIDPRVSFRQIENGTLERNSFSFYFFSFQKKWIHWMLRCFACGIVFFRRFNIGIKN